MTAKEKKRAEEAAVERDVLLYCDGACRGNPGPGGYAAVLLCDGHEREIKGAEPNTTNNRMELRAAIAGLETLKEKCLVRIVTDSQYLKKGMTEWIQGWISNGWRTAARRPVLNRDLWERLQQLCAKHVVSWDWVEGHAGDTLNERCDALANEAIDELLASRRGPG